jgi:hypothetical protein
VVKNKQGKIIMATRMQNSNQYIINNQDIFESVRKRVSAGNGGCTVFVPHVCNNIDLFGAGFAGQVANEYPSVKANYHMLGKTFLKGNRGLGYSQILNTYEDPKYKHKLYFVNMIAQNGIRGSNNTRPLNYAALVKCMVEIKQYIHQNTGFLNKNEQIEIHAPKFGSGLAGGNWNFISDLIDDIWGNHTVYIYNYKK